MRGGASLMGLAAASALGVGATAPASKVYGHGNIKRMLQRHGRSRQFGSFDPRVNAWTGKPHEHAEEIARRLRQAKRDAERQAARLEAYAGPAVKASRFVGMSRRGWFLRP